MGKIVGDWAKAVDQSFLRLKRPGKAGSSDGLCPPAALARLGAGVASAVRAARWEPERPGAKSLWLLPSGPDQVGDDPVRQTPTAHMAGSGGGIKPA